LEETVELENNNGRLNAPMRYTYDIAPDKKS
jgi:hypothetical protein